MKLNDKEKPSLYVTYLNENDLYEQTIIQYLPTGGFKWLTHDEINKFDVNAIWIFILEVDLKYQEKLHDLHNEHHQKKKHVVKGQKKEIRFRLVKLKNLNET